MTNLPLCPQCNSTDVRYREKRADWFCDGCDHSWAAAAPAMEATPRAAHPLQIFLSYGHDERTVDAIRIKDDLEKRGHTVWFDDERLLGHGDQGVRGGGVFHLSTGPTDFPQIPRQPQPGTRV
jgi:hypothetical protein